MGGFTKLFSRILTSSIWSESNEVRIVWITLLAATGPDGIARVTLPGLARLSNLSIQDTEKAIAVLSSPDKYSRSVSDDGRRIREEREPNGNLIGFYVLNYSKYRAVDATAAKRKRQQRAREAKVTRDRHARQKTEDRRQKRTTELRSLRSRRLRPGPRRGTKPLAVRLRSGTGERRREGGSPRPSGLSWRSTASRLCSRLGRGTSKKRPRST